MACKGKHGLCGEFRKFWDDYIKDIDNLKGLMPVAKTRNNSVKKKVRVKKIPEKEYAEFFEKIKNMIQESQLKVADYGAEILRSLPKDFKSNVPTVKQFEAQLEKKDLLSKKKPQKVHEVKESL